MAKKQSDVVTQVANRLREEHGVNLGSIPVDRLEQEIAYAVQNGDDVTVKIPSRSEFRMSVQEAEAVLQALRG